MGNLQGLTLDSELRVRLVSRKLPFHTYKLLAEWLGVYTYILPQNRIFIEKLRTTSYFSSPSDLFKLCLWIDQIYSTLNEVDQESLCKLISASSISHTPRC